MPPATEEKQEGAMPDDPNATPPATPPTPTQTTEPPATPPATTETTPPNGELGEAGKAALESERRARRDAEKLARDAQTELDRYRQASMTDQEKAVDAARRDGERAGLRRIIEAEVKAAAAGKLANPQLAARLLNVDEFMPKDGEEVDGERIAKAIDELVRTDPYLAAPTTAPPPATPPAPGTVPGGARGASTAAGTFTRTQLRDPAFYQAHKDEILKAAAEGRITDD